MFYTSICCVCFSFFAFSSLFLFLSLLSSNTTTSSNSSSNSSTNGTSNSETVKKIIIVIVSSAFIAFLLHFLCLYKYYVGHVRFYYNLICLWGIFMFHIMVFWMDFRLGFMNGMLGFVLYFEWEKWEQNCCVFIVHCGKYRRHHYIMLSMLLIKLKWLIIICFRH